MARPSKYDPDTVPEQARKLAMLGLTDREMAGFFGVSEQTLNAWKARHPEFLESLKAGKDVADAEVAVSLYQRATGYSHPEDDIRSVGGEIVITPTTKRYPPDTMAAMYWLNNRQRGRWNRSPDPNGGDADLPPTKVIFEVRDASSPDRKSEPEPAAS